jgi:hypothetical protein
MRSAFEVYGYTGTDKLCYTCNEYADTKDIFRFNDHWYCWFCIEEKRHEQPNDSR